MFEGRIGPLLLEIRTELSPWGLGFRRMSSLKVENKGSRISMIRFLLTERLLPRLSRFNGLLTARARGGMGSPSTKRSELVRFTCFHRRSQISTRLMPVVTAKRAISLAGYFRC